MDTKKIEKRILDELEEEIRELKRQGKLHKIEDAMDHAMEKFKDALTDRTAGVVDALDDDENSLKKLQTRMKIQLVKLTYNPFLRKRSL